MFFKFKVTLDFDQKLLITKNILNGIIGQIKLYRAPTNVSNSFLAITNLDIVCKITTNQLNAMTVHHAYCYNKINPTQKAD